MFPLRILKKLCFSSSLFNKFYIKTQKFAFSNETLKNNNQTPFSSPKDYIKECTHTFENLMEKLDNIDHLQNLDVNYSEGVLVITFNQKTFVVNRQIPNQQIWYSSPISGPARFDFYPSEKKWRNSRKEELEELLFAEIFKLQ